jgi:hypothetical protein
MNRTTTRTIAITALAAATLLVGCGTSGSDDAAPIATSTSILEDGSVATYELDEDGEVVGLIDPSTLEADGGGAADAAAGAGSDGSSATPSGGSGSGSGGDGSASTSGTGSSGAGSGGSASGPASEPRGGATGGGSTDGGSTSPAPAPDDAAAQAPEVAPEPDPAPAPAPASAPSISLSSQRCSSGKLIVGITANASGGYRKGIGSVSMARQNEYGAFLSAPATWLGLETGQGNVWNGTLVGNQQNIGKTLRVTATGDDGRTTTQEYAITVPC